MESVLGRYYRIKPVVVRAINSKGDYVVHDEGAENDARVIEKRVFESMYQKAEEEA